MAYNSDTGSATQDNGTTNINLTQNKDGNFELPSGYVVSNAEFYRDGQDLTLKFTDQNDISIENYFTNQDDPLIQDDAGNSANNGLINSFLQSSPEYAQTSSLTDESPIGAVEEIKGEATLIRADGNVEDITLGTPVYQGDVIQTSGDGALNITFIDETSLAISENAKVALDNYKFDAKTESGETDISVLRGVFVYTSGLIGRDDPDDVKIDTPVGSIGIRGTIIAGNINPNGQSEISVLEGAIVITNGVSERTLSQQFETIQLTGFNDAIEYKGVEAANTISKTYGSVNDVLPKLFSSINDATKEEVIEEEVEASEENNDIESNEQETLEPESTLDTQDIIELEIGETGEATAIETSTDSNVTTEQTSLNSGLQESDLNRTTIDDPAFQEFLDRPVETRTETETTTPPPPPPAVPSATIDIFDSSGNLLFEGNKSGVQVGKVVLSDVPTADLGSVMISDNNNIFSYTQDMANQNEFTITVDDEAAARVPSNNIITITIGSTSAETINLPLDILDAAVHLNTPGGFDYDVDSGVAAVEDHLLNPQDFDGDGDRDFVTTITSTDPLLNGELGIYDNKDLTQTISTSDPGLNIKYPAVTFLGDINNDGYADIVGLTTNVSDFSIINGSATPPSTVTPQHINLPGGITTNPTSVASAGDFNTGSKSDFVLGAADDNGGQGRVIIQYGPSNAGFILNGGTGDIGLGSQVFNLGDVNGDGVTDVLTTEQNSSYVIFGREDPRSESYDTFIASAGSGETSLITSSRGVKVEDASQVFVTAGSTGDINGDGFDDFAVSFDDGTDINTYVVYGENGIEVPSDLDLNYLENPDNALKINHDGATGQNYQITALGDVDGDGFDDIQLGIEGGEQFIVHGAAGGSAHVIVTDQSDNDDNMNAGIISASGDLQSLVGNVDFDDSDKIGIRISGGDGDNIINISNDDFAKIDSGNGFDRINIVTQNGNLDFTNLQYEQVENIEQINFGNTDQTVTLDAISIFNLLKQSDNNDLRISGDLGGTLNITDASGGTTGFLNDRIVDILNSEGEGATHETNITLDGNEYSHFKIGGYDLYIDTDITTAVVV